MYLLQKSPSQLKPLILYIPFKQFQYLQARELGSGVSQESIVQSVEDVYTFEKQIAMVWFYKESIHVKLSTQQIICLSKIQHPLYKSAMFNVCMNVTLLYVLNYASSITRPQLCVLKYASSSMPPQLCVCISSYLIWALILNNFS